MRKLFLVSLLMTTTACDEPKGSSSVTVKLEPAAAILNVTEEQVLASVENLPAAPQISEAESPCLGTWVAPFSQYRHTQPFTLVVAQTGRYYIDFATGRDDMGQWRADNGKLSLRGDKSASLYDCTKTIALMTRDGKEYSLRRDEDE